jgi:hypothetical protein
MFLTGGEKDVMTLAGLGYPAISLNSETSDIDPKQVQELKSRFRYVIVLYDCDATGIEQSAKLVETHSLMQMTLNLSGTKDSKDVSDFVKQGGTKEEFKVLIDEVIDNKFKSTLKILRPHIFNDSVSIERPIPVLTIDGHTILSRGNLSVISGKVKTGKSALNYSLLAGAIRMEGLPIDTLGVNVTLNREEQAVIHFDTEQSKYDWHNKLKQTVNRAGISSKPDFFESYHLLEFTIWDRIKYLEDMFEYNHRKHNGIYLAVVDGVADLVKSVNDEVECNKIVDLFHRLAVEYDCPIVLLAHLNPDGGKMRGHLGSQLERKAESVLVVEREGEISNINPLFCRNANFLKIPLQQFYWNEDKKEHSFYGQKTEEDKQEQKIAEYEDVLSEIFSESQPEIKKSEFKEKICKVMGVKKSSAYNIINFMLNHALIKEDHNTKAISRANVAE